MSFKLSVSDKNYLLKLARDSISRFLDDKKLDPQFVSAGPLTTECGVFVTLTFQTELRGCIGYVKGYRPLHEAVAELALSAAFNDPRFPPVQKNELDDIEIEISVLSPLERVHHTDDIKVGRDGLFISKKPYEGLLLPQVAGDYGWDRETFLRETCRKANLPADSWQKPDTEIYRFTAIIFSESNHPGEV